MFSGKIEKAKYNSKKNRFDINGKIKNANIYIYENSQLIDKSSASKNGEFTLFLQADLVYKIEFVSSGFVSKSVQIDTRNLTIAYLIKDQKIYSDLTLCEQIPGMNFTSYEKLPVAKCAFNKHQEKMVWDMNYSEQTYSTFLTLVSSKNDMQSSYGVKKPVTIANETITEEETDYSKESEWLDSYLNSILDKL